MGRGLRVVLIAVVAFVLVAAGGVAWFQRQVNPPGAAGSPISVTIPPGASSSAIAAILDDKGVIKSARVFKLYLKLHPTNGLEAGAYTLRARESFGSVIDKLQSGPETTFDRLTIPEGYTLKQIAAKVGQLPGRSAEAFLAAAVSGTIRSEFQPANVNNLEGLIFPDTYFVESKDTEAVILKRMVDQFDTIATEEGLAKGSLGHTPYETLTIASLVESEGKVAKDRPKIARVIENRLKAGMMLQIDATVIYARGGVRRPGGRVLFSDLKTQSPYNTYVVKGLPPTPISATGRAALRATLNPADGKWLYYVKFQTDGTHQFSETLAQHNAAAADAKRRGVNP
ncbi:MAG: endolytic transglycosylase MltG [Actinobacteria bacterium]|nr:endolytic transglycosylase MltG [Actinomycetota bacterium]